MFPLCQYSGLLTRSGKRFCRLHSPKPLVNADQCNNCQHASGAHLDLFPVCREDRGRIKCSHRGNQIGTKRCETCGGRGYPIPVFSCKIHGACSEYKISQLEKSIISCTDCSDQKYSDLPDVEYVSNLVWFVWPRREAEQLWRSQLETITGRISLFSGHTLAVIAEDDSTGDVSGFADELRSLFGEVQVYANDPELREVPGWEYGMVRMQSEPGFTVFLHAKGVYRGCNEHHLQRWWQLAYRTMLDLDSVYESLAENLITGCFRRNYYAQNLQCPWHYSGTFYAVRNSAIQFPESSSGGWYAETWPSLIAPRDHAGCLRFDNCDDLYQASNWKEGVER